MLFICKRIINCTEHEYKLFYMILIKSDANIWKLILKMLNTI